VADSVATGAKGIVIITAGLGESSAEGKKIEADILSMAATGGAKLIGPNCSGLFSAPGRMNLLGIPHISPGPLAVIAQSGNIIDSLTHYSALRGVGLSTIISTGNAIGVKFHEYLEYLGQDAETRVIMMYMEGITEGDRLVRIAREVCQHKPVIILKVGRSQAGIRAAASHTGSLAGVDAIVDAAFRQAGILRVSNVDEMFDTAICFAHLPLPRGKRVAIMSEGGGDNSVAADNAESWGLEVPILPRAAQERITPYLLPGMPAANPIDYGGTAEENPDVINRVAEVLMLEDTVDAIYITGFFGGFKEIIAPHIGELEEKTARELVRLVKTYHKPLAVHSSFANEPLQAIQVLKDNAGMFVTSSSARAAECLAHMARFAENRHHLAAAADVSATSSDDIAARQLLANVHSSGRTLLLETEARALFALYGIELPPAIPAKSAAEAVQAAGQLGYPVALKIMSPKIIHKSEAGGVQLNLNDADAVRTAYHAVMDSAGRLAGPEDIEGVLVAPMAPLGQECIVGMVRNPQFGPVVMFGLGGIFVEVLKDVAFRVMPLTDRDVDGMLREIQGFALLQGIRGKKPKDIGTLKEILVRVGQLGLDFPEILEVDINPVIVHEKGASIVDARVILHQKK
jgi:acetyltransferase